MRIAKGGVSIAVCGLTLMCSCAGIQSRRDGYVKEHPSMSFTAKNAVVNGEVIQGMTTEEVRASWGEPENVTAFKDAAGSGEQWTFFKKMGKYTSVREVIFSGGKVQDIKDNRFSGSYLPGTSGNVGVMVNE